MKTTKRIKEVIHNPANWPFKISRFKTEKELLELACDLVEWSKNETAFKISEFFVEKDITPRYFYEIWIPKYDFMKEANEIAKTRIGNRRERRAAEGTYNANVIMKTMGMYDDQYKAHCEWEAGLTKKDDSQQGNIKILVEKYPSTEIVPERH